MIEIEQGMQIPKVVDKKNEVLTQLVQYVELSQVRQFDSTLRHGRQTVPLRR